jgi:glycosyltransferase involved in cell wall biosynthesis
MTSKCRVCLISPSHLSTNPRLVKEARALSDAGYKVQIICGRYLPWGTVQDVELKSSDWDVTAVPFGKREARLGTHVKQKIVQSVSTRLYHGGLRFRHLAEMAQSPVASDLIAATCNAPRADLYIAHYLPALSAAAIAARKHNARYAFDAEDFHLGDLPDETEHLTAKALIRHIESSYLPGAAYVTAASPLIADAYAETYGIPRPAPILNVFPRANAPKAPTPRGTATPGPSLYWFSQTIGPGRGLETALDAIAIARTRPHLHLRGTPAIGYRTNLTAHAASLGVEKQLHFHEPASPTELERLGAAFDIGFVGEIEDTRNRAIALTNKLFSYWMSGLPTIVSDIPAHKPYLKAHLEFVQGFTDAPMLANRLDFLLGDAEGLAAARQSAFAAAASIYNWEHETVTWLQLVDGLLQGPPEEPLPE